MRLSSMFFALLFSSASFAAQAQAGASPPLYVRPPASQACPVGFWANRESGFQPHIARSASSPPGMAIEVNFRNNANSVIVKADILVHGVKTTRPEGLILTGPATPNSPSSPAANDDNAAAARQRIEAARAPISSNSTETIQVLGTADAPLLHSVVWTKSMTAIRWLELTRIEYADGKVWQSSPESRCIAAPSLYVPVTNGR